MESQRVGEMQELEVLVTEMCSGVKDFERGDGDNSPNSGHKRSN